MSLAHWLCLLLVTLHCSNTAPVKILSADKREAGMQTFLLKLLNAAYKERNYNTILLLEQPSERCFPGDIARLLKSPLLLLGINHAQPLKRYYNSEFLALVCMRQRFDAALMAALAENLQNMRQNRIILLIKDNALQLQPLQEFLQQHKMTNTLVLHENSYLQREIQRYYPFPAPRFARVRLATLQRYFPRHRSNLQGKVILTLPDQIEPRTLLYADHAGRQQLSGYIAKFVVLFAEKHNARLQYAQPVQIGDVKHMVLLKNLTDREVLDLPITVYTPLKPGDLIYTLSYPVELSSWMIMVPCAQPIPITAVYAITISRTVVCILVALLFVYSLLHTWLVRATTRNRRNDYLNCVLNDKMLRGILGQSFILRHVPLHSTKLLYLSLFLLGLIFSTMYSAYLKALLTTPPLMPQLDTLQRIRSANMKIVMDANEIIMMNAFKGADFYPLNQDIIEIVDTELYLHYRTSLNSAHTYTVTTSLWPLLNQLQHYYSRKIFYTPPTLILWHQMMLCIPLQHNSEYRDILNEFILEVHAAGLIHHWQMLTFFDMVALGKLSLKDTSQPAAYYVLRIEDLKVPFLFFLSGLAVSSVAFCAELLISLLSTYGKSSRKSLRVGGV